MASRTSGIRFSTTLAAALALSACGGNHTPPLSGAFRLANLISDSGGLQAAIGPIPAVGPVDFDAASGLVIVQEGSYRVHLSPGTAGAAAYDVDDVDIGQDTLTTLFAYGTVTGGGTHDGFTARESVLAPSAGQVRMQVVYAASGPADFGYSFVFEPVGGSGQTGSASAVFGPVGPSQAISLAAGRYEIKVTGAPICQPGMVCPAIGEFLFDSGPQGVDIPGASGANVFQLAAADATADQSSQYSARVVLLLLDNEGGGKLLLNGQN
jgi:hypothetical protein